jgi:hypothetical protein
MAQGSSSFLVFFDRDPNDQSSFRDFSLPGASGKGQSETPKSDFEDRSVVEEQEDFKRGDAGKPQEEPDEEEEEEVIVALDEAAWSCALAASAFSYSGPGWLSQDCVFEDRLVHS